MDKFHFDTYGVQAVNYNRDLAAFPLLREILSRITGQDNLYASPTDMGVNMIASGIVDDKCVQDAAKQEVIRRYFRALCDYKKGLCELDVVKRIEGIMAKLEISTLHRPVVKHALDIKANTKCHAFSIMLGNGEIISGRTKTLSAPCACILNTIKKLAGIEDDYALIPQSIIKPILSLNKEILGSRSDLLSLKDMLLALSVSATTNNLAAKALLALKQLKNLEAHSTFILSQTDEDTIKKLGILLTSEPEYPSANLFE